MPAKLELCCNKDYKFSGCISYFIWKYSIVSSIVGFCKLFHFYGRQNTAYLFTIKGQHIIQSVLPCLYLTSLFPQLENVKVNMLPDCVCWPWRYKSRKVSSARKSLGRAGIPSVIPTLSSVRENALFCLVHTYILRFGSSYISDSLLWNNFVVHWKKLTHGIIEFWSCDPRD